MATGWVTCRESLPTTPPSPALPGEISWPTAPTAPLGVPLTGAVGRPDTSPPAIDPGALDRLALGLRQRLDALTVPLARAAHLFVERRGWTDLGYARLDDHARERLGRSGRWVRDLGVLGRGLEEHPALEDALTGRDGGRPIGTVAARLIAGIADSGSIQPWIAAARMFSIRELKERIRQGGELEPGVTSMRLRVPLAVHAAWEETRDLYFAVEGRQAGTTAFVEALVGEALSGATGGESSSPIETMAGEGASRGGGGESGSGVVDHEAPEAGRSRPGLAARRNRREAELARATDGWRHLPAPGAPEAGAIIDPDAILLDPEVAIRRLLALQERLERQLGELLAAMDDARAWHRLRFASLGHYAEQRLGLARSTAIERAWLARALRRLPAVRRAYETGTLGLSAALRLVRFLERLTEATGVPAAGAEAAWTARACEVTVKRLTDEIRAAGRALAEGRDALPLDDAAWQASLARRAGTARERLLRCAEALACANTDEAGAESVAVQTLARKEVTLRLALPEDLALDFEAALEDACRQPAARMFSTGGGGVPRWAGLLVLLAEFTATWDATHHPRRRARDAVYIRDGWRCMAPGCTSRRHLEDHHVRYRSRGGGDEAGNRITLCRFHHQQGEHGGLARVRGRAPLGLVWVLGRQGRGGRWHNERRPKKRAAANRGPRASRMRVSASRGVAPGHRGRSPGRSS